MRTCRLIICTAMAWCMSLQYAFSAPVESVHVDVGDASGGTSRVLLDKMSGSMQVVAEQLFLDKDDADIAAASADYENLMKEIGDRVFTGYELERTEIIPGKMTSVKMFVRPWSEVISAPAIDLQFSGVDSDTAAFLEARVPQLTQELAEAISGASVAAGDWAGGVLRKIVRDELQDKLPEFKAAVDVLQDEKGTTVQVVIYPVGQMVTDIRYDMHSESIPNILLMELKNSYREKCGKLRGIPVAYAERHKQELEAMIRDMLLEEKEIKYYHLRPVVIIQPGSSLGIDINIVSNEYKIYFEGYGDIGRDSGNLSGKAHIGRLATPQDEIFGEAEVVLDDVDWNYGAGYTRYWGKSGWTYMRRMPDGENVWKLEYSFNPKWRLRAEHFSGDDRNEFGVRYRIHEFLSAEYVYGGDEFYLRIIGNL